MQGSPDIRLVPILGFRSGLEMTQRNLVPVWSDPDPYSYSHSDFWISRTPIYLNEDVQMALTLEDFLFPIAMKYDKAIDGGRI